ncbi:MAG: hypothetical protein QOG31_429 [Thermoplasmata archaeon]|jgi:hypothetical protein|nr:hypothetical protein [Thermoplasmata archaeon]
MKSTLKSQTRRFHTGNSRTAAIAFLSVSILLTVGCFGQVHFNRININNLTPEKKSIHVAILDGTKTWFNATVQVNGGGGGETVPFSLPNGNYVVRATSGSLQKEETVTVREGVAGITVTVTETTIQVGATILG